MYAITGTDEPSIMSNRVSASPPAKATPFMGYGSGGKWTDPWHGCYVLDWVNVPCEAESLIPIDDSVPGQGQGLPPVGSGGVPNFDCGSPLDEIDLCNLVPETPYDPIAYEPGDGQILVMGSLSLDTGEATLEPGPIIETGTPDIWLDNERDDDPYLLVLLDAAGNVLSAQNIDNAKWSAHRPLGHGDTIDPPGELRDIRFGEMAPRVDGLATIALVHGTDVLATLEPGRSAPMVAGVVAEIIDARVAISWTAEDPDGDPISTIVQYETSDGWSTIATPGPGATSVAVDATALAGGRSAIFRVIASDGVNRASADSAPVDLPDGAPTVAVAAPADETRRAHGRSIDLWAMAHDAETESPTIAWFSDRDGSLGEGARLRVDSLTIGRHVITATATDADGASSADSIVVSIGPPDGVGAEMLDAIATLFAEGPAARPVDDGTNTRTIAVVVAGLVVALLGIAYYVRRRGAGRRLISDA